MDVFVGFEVECMVVYVYGLCDVVDEMYFDVLLFVIVECVV